MDSLELPAQGSNLEPPGPKPGATASCASGQYARNPTTGVTRVPRRGSRTPFPASAPYTDQRCPLNAKDTESNRDESSSSRDRTWNLAVNSRALLPVELMGNELWSAVRAAVHTPLRTPFKHSSCVHIPASHSVQALILCPHPRPFGTRAGSRTPRHDATFLCRMCSGPAPR